MFRRVACRHVRDGRSKLGGLSPLVPSPGVEPVESASFGGSSLKSVRTKVLVSSAGIEPATTDFVDQSLDDHQDEERRRWVVRGRKRTRTPHPFRGAHCFRNRSGSIASFSSIGGQCGNRTRYAELFRLPLYQLSLPTRIIVAAEEGRGLEPHTHDVRIAFQAISAASPNCLPLEIEGQICVMAQDAGARSLLHSVRPRAVTRSTAARPREHLPRSGGPATSPGETWA